MVSYKALNTISNCNSAGKMVINGPPQNVMYPSDQDGSITKLRTARSKPLTSYVIFIIEV